MKKKVIKKRTRSQIGKSSHDKGDGFEFKVARMLSEILFPYEEKRIKKTPRSGGFDKRMLCGDLMDVLDVDFPFAFELKNQEVWSFDSIFAGKCTAFWKYWDQATDDVKTWNLSNKTSKIPMLIFTRNYNPEYIMFEPDKDITDILPKPLAVLNVKEGTFHIHYLSTFYDKVKELYTFLKGKQNGGPKNQDSRNSVSKNSETSKSGGRTTKCTKTENRASGA